jgi:iron(III) transport system substrate-binding protein
MKRLVIALAACAFAWGCGLPKESVVVYSPHGPEMLKEAEARFEAANPGVDLQWFDMGSQEVYNRITSERARPQADVWWGGPSTMFMKAAEEGLLEPYRPTWAEAVPAEYKSADDTWYGTFRSPLAIVFNTRGYEKAEVPQSWDELLDPKWKGKIALRNPLPSGTLRTFIGAMILRAPDEDAGVEWLKRLNAQVEGYSENPQLFFDHLKRNPELVSVWLMPDVVLQRELNGYPFDYVVPAETPVITEGIAVVQGARHPELAKKFYEFVNTPELLALQAEKFAKMPARTDLDPDTLPPWMVAQAIEPMAIDWAAFAAKEQEWMDRWQREVRGAP